MAIKRYIANADTTIANAYEANLTTRGTGSNMGLSDSLEVFSIYGQTISGSNAAKTAELSRILVNFPVSDIATDRTNKDIPASGSVSFYLRMFNAEHPFTVPVNFTLSASAVTTEWEEGYGLDMEGYRDLTDNGIGANWMNAASGTAWTTVGGDFDKYTTSSFKQTFENGVEDLEMDITPLVEQWVNSGGNVYGDKSSARYGIAIYLTGSQEAYFSGSSETSDSYHVISGTPIFHNLSGSTKSYYTKKFYARGSEYFFKRPIIEARWDSSKKDNRGNFYLSSSLATAADNLNTLYLYNYMRGQLTNIPNLGGPGAESDVTKTKLDVKIYGTLGAEPKALPIGGGVTTNGHSFVTASYVDTGVYSASFAYTGSETTIYDVWRTGSSTVTIFHTGSAIAVKSFNSYNMNPNDTYVTSITNLRSIYSNKETARFRLFTRKKDWNPTIYTKATAEAQTEIVEDVYYKVYRIYDDLTAVDYGTGSLNHTRASYDISGSYFDLDMSMFRADYMYGIKFIYYLNGKYTEQPKVFKFRVEKDLTDIE